jgi:hypothetical protein
MVNVISKLCEFIGCEIQPSYNILGKNKGRFCNIHKESDMIDVINKKCKMIGCNTIPVYNNPGEIRGLYCVKHKDISMINVVGKTCEIDGCDTKPSYNYRGESSMRFCSIHKEPEMICIINKTCEMDKCEKYPRYNTPGEIGGRFCINHKETNMINVISKICEANNCSKRANFGWLSKGITTCATHKQKGMIIAPNRKCETMRCTQLGTYEANGTRFCEIHKPDNSENLGIDKCTLCGLDDILTNGHCISCDPSIINIRRYAKENRVKKILTDANIIFVHDKILEDASCGRERPDFQIDCGTHYVYIEVDENQHDSYTCECEQIRMINLIEVRGLPVRWIRYNPDTYKPIIGQSSVNLKTREMKLLEYVTYASKHSPQEDSDFSNVLYLFYDDYDITCNTWHKLK